MHPTRSLLLLWLALAGVGLPPLAAAEPEYRQMGPDIFDRHASGEELIAAALARAQPEGRRVLLFFGANWCPWCRRLHGVFTTAPAVTARLERSFDLVYVDANMRHDRNRNAAVIARYGHPLRHGLPVLVLLAPDGTMLTTQETASLAAVTDEEVAARVAAFLDAWKPAPPARP